MIDSLLNNLLKKYEIKTNEIEVVASAIRGILKDPDLV